MPSIPSYYFTLFKKFQTLGHVPQAQYHGSAGGVESVHFNDPAALLTMARNGKLLIGSAATEEDSPLWGVLNSKVLGTGLFLTSDGQIWYEMPEGPAAADAWADFGGQPLVDAFAAWIGAGKPNDFPSFISLPNGGTVPGTGDAGGAKPFVCSYGADDGIRPGNCPNNYWATSLIYLVSSTNGAQALPSSLSNGSEYYLAAVVGNRGDASGGKYSWGPAAAASPGLEADAWVMAWGTGGATPSVQLSSLSENDATSIAGTNDIYFLNSLKYDIVGFRFPVKTVFDALVLAIDAAAQNGTFVLPAGITPEEYLTTPPSHVCAKVRIRRDDGLWPSLSDNPLSEPRIAQKNLVVFDPDNMPATPNPNITWMFFSMGGPMPDLLRPLWVRDGELGENTLIIRSDFKRTLGRIHLAIPRSTYRKWIGKGRVKGFDVLDADRGKVLGVPFADHVVLSQKEAEAAIRVPFMNDHCLAMALGVEINRKNFAVDATHQVEVEHRAVVPVFGQGEQKRCYRPGNQTVGGFTMRFRKVRKEKPRGGGRKSSH